MIDKEGMGMVAWNDETFREIWSRHWKLGMDGKQLKYTVLDSDLTWKFLTKLCD